MSHKTFISSQFQKPGVTGVWWHEKNPGPLNKMPFITQFGHMKFTKINLDKNMKPHLNDGIELHYVEGGKYEWEFEGRKVELLPDDLSITAPWHLNGSPSGKMDLGEINWLIIKPEQFSIDTPLRLGAWTKLPRALQRNIGTTIASENGIVLKKVPEFKKYFLELRSELTEQKKGYKMVVVNVLENMFIALERHLENQKLQIEQQDSFIKMLNQTIQSDLTHKWVVEYLAEQFGMGKTKFTEEVKRLTGYPPNSYIINLKIGRAKTLLKNQSPLSLSDIAYECGFSSLQHFTSSFAQRTGFSPAVYRSKNKPPK
jgi:AraC-like DNA-binding protein